jgi:hypothetical protein
LNHQIETNTTLKNYIMKFKALLLAVSIFGATFFVTSTTTDNDNKDEIKKTAVDKRTIKVPPAG